MFGTTVLALGVQLAYNHYVTGHLKLSSYGQEQFIKLGEYFIDVLFSYECGLITYYPIFAVAIVLGLAWLREKIIYIFIALVFAMLYGSWHSWPIRGRKGLTKKQSNKYLIVVMLTMVVCVYITIAVMKGY